MLSVLQHEGIGQWRATILCSMTNWDNWSKINMLSRIQSVTVRFGVRYYGKVGIIGVPFEKGQV